MSINIVIIIVTTPIIINIIENGCCGWKNVSPNSICLSYWWHFLLKKTAGSVSVTFVSQLLYLKYRKVHTLSDIKLIGIATTYGKAFNFRFARNKNKQKYTQQSCL